MRIADILDIKASRRTGKAEIPAEEVALREVGDVVTGDRLAPEVGEGEPDHGLRLARRWAPEVERYYDLFLKRAEDLRERVQAKRNISPSPILSDLYRLINDDLIEEFYSYAMMAHQDKDDLVTHGIDVLGTCLVVGVGLKLDIKMLLKLGLAAVLENVGMYRVPERILHKREKLSEEEISSIQDHPRESYEILVGLGEKYRWLADTALGVHERMDGSGYPNGLSGEKISPLSFIIGLADMYTAMIRERPHRKRFRKSEAIKYIVGETKGLFPLGIRKVFLDRVSLFPVGTYVRLNSGTVGCVIATNRKHAIRPTIQVIHNAAGQVVEEEEILNLGDNPLLYIAEEVDQDGFPKMRFQKRTVA
ncbi:MAG: HD domain-containing protein [Deltaproteobacteria bacterium]|nr:HD domain-containing protein [Deltaproteobacteria bacterium]MBW2136922.1 HD domain-containing protein [Deltaproteobacteria bacterium]